MGEGGMRDTFGVLRVTASPSTQELRAQENREISNDGEARLL